MQSRLSMELFSVLGKVVLVTGGTRGIGELIARAFVEAGARVYICGRKRDACERVARELGSIGFCAALPADLSQASEVTRLVTDLRSREDGLDILVNNAGITWGAALAEYPLEAWDKVFAVNVRAVFQLSRDLLPMLRVRATAADPSRIVNLGSIAGSHIPRGTSAYAYGASKAAVHHLTRMLAPELAELHVTVNAIAPSVFPSRMTAHNVDGESMLTLAGRGTPLHRAGDYADIAGTCLFLCSRAGAYVTGAVLPLDGGLHVKPLEWLESPCKQ